MLATLEILLPVFGLIFAGFACRRRGVLGPNSASELNRFVVWLALPALLFDTMAHATWQQLYQPAFVAAFSIGCIGAFLPILALRMIGGRHLADASVDAIAASYPNTGYIGFPLGMIAFGSASLTPTTIATILVACVLFALAIVLIEVGLQTERTPHKLGLKVLGSLARNPLIVSPIAGVLLASTHVALPQSAETFLKLLSGAASPCALVSLGLFLAEKRPSEAGAGGISLLLTGVKLLGQPALTWWLAARVFGLSATLVEMAVVLAALPTGTGPFMLAEFYRREAHITSRTILLSTVGSVVTLSLLLLVMGHRT
ncbi:MULTISPECIES: AEC family transporter [Paraburkholderia]|uniref:AEC family transporter n=1 Tax=Paraburkholderia madseniana TaxID=2599607 RepID=A0AAP5B8W1_9BURK|nr:MULTISPECIES: AEC family transporter [Paraburkholderia]MCX4144229.1 AEC family transporter [Paraburkholderia madseniana]MDN7147182.1 AEC family transporter [Paraburkholderia sp. WS6]MDQ6406062.1 AEC family transporter [Paraburkholderia madseniana]